MRRPVLLCLALLCAVPAHAQSQPPHAWLFGSWTGGLFPIAAPLTQAACLAQRTVVFAPDAVLRATLTQSEMTSFAIETARATPGGTEFRLTPATTNPQAYAAASPQGFGCKTPNDLLVQRRTENEITFPGCADFPYPLVRCH